MPALVQQCGKWDTCMNRDPTIVGRAKVGAETIAEVLDGFVQPISWKALVRSSSVAEQYIRSRRTRSRAADFCV